MPAGRLTRSCSTRPTAVRCERQPTAARCAVTTSDCQDPAGSAPLTGSRLGATEGGPQASPVRSLRESHAKPGPDPQTTGDSSSGRSDRGHNREFVAAFGQQNLTDLVCALLTRQVNAERAQPDCDPDKRRGGAIAPTLTAPTPAGPEPIGRSGHHTSSRNGAREDHQEKL